MTLWYCTVIIPEDMLLIYLEGPKNKKKLHIVAQFSSYSIGDQWNNMIWNMMRIGQLLFHFLGIIFHIFHIFHILLVHVGPIPKKHPRRRDHGRLCSLWGHLPRPILSAVSDIFRDHKGEIVPGYFQEFPRTDVDRCWSSDLRGNVESSSRVQEKCHSSRRSSEAFVEVDMPKKYTNLIQQAL